MENSENSDTLSTSATDATSVDLPGAATPGADTTANVTQDSSGNAETKENSVIELPKGATVESVYHSQGEATVKAVPEKRGRGRPRKDTTERLNSVTNAPPKIPPAVQVQLPIKVDHEKLARQAANLWFNVGSMIFGDDWKPDNAEVMPVKDAFKDYFETTNITSIPPSWNLLIVLGGYTAARLTKPTVKTRLFGAFEWIKSKLPFQR